MAAVFARAQLLTPWKAPVECDIPTVANLYGTQMSAKAVASTASQRSIKAITPTASQTWWGYFSVSNASSLDFSGNLGYSSAVTLNAAIMVDGNNSFVKGSTIKAVRFWLGDDLSAINSDLTVWISKSLPASASAADYKQTIPKANISTRLNEVELTTPYDATSLQSGDKLYIGFSFSISGETYPIMAGGTEIPGGFYYNAGSRWIDFVGEGYKNGNLALQLLLDGGTYPTNCASIDNLGQKVVKSGSSVSIPCKITNKGIDDITSLEFTIKDANGSTQTVTRTLSNSLALNSSTEISLSFDAASTAQKSDISVTVTKVNGVDNTLSASDGQKTGTGTLITVSSAPTVVPVVEEFTGTWCGYCPYGTVAMQKAHQQYGDKIVQIAIHSGDPMAVSDYSPVISAYCNGYPNATIDRLSTFHAANIPYRLTSAFNRVSQGMIELTAEWSDAGKTAVKFNTKSTFGYSDSNGQYGVVLLLTEDGMTGTSSNWSQSNYLSGGSGNSDMQFWYDSPSTVSGLEYDHVAVAVWNALYGADGSIPSSFTADTPIEYNFTGDISSNTLIQDKTKLKAVALLIDRVSGNIVNAAQCSLNGDDTPDETPKAYAALSEDNTVLTFYYDTNKESRNGMNVGPFSYKYVNGENIVTGRGWNDYVSSITKVVFDASFAEYRPTSTAYWFYKCETLANITGIENLKTDEVTDMSNMFDKCSGLTSLDVSNFNTENVKGMSSMFRGCSGLTSVNVSNFNTSNVTDMYGMFYDCSKLTNLDVSNFKTDNVTSMSHMFCGCSGLTSLDVSKFNTSKVTDMMQMFGFCSGLTALDVSNFNTNNVTNMYCMFCNCSSLTSLDVSNFNTCNVTDMGSMFYRCSGLTSLDVSKFNTSNVTRMPGMFEVCSGLTNLDLSNFNTEKVTSMSGMFYGCSGITNLDLSNFNTRSVTDMRRMFYGCSGLTTIKVNSDKWTTANVTQSENMFYRCTKLVGGAGTTYDANHVDVAYAHVDGGTSNPGYLTDVNAIPFVTPEAYAALSKDNTVLTFYYDANKANRNGMSVGPFTRSYVDGVYKITGREWNDYVSTITKVVFDATFADYMPTSTAYWFYDCKALTTIAGIENLKTDNVTNMYCMFYGCSGLTSLDVSKFNTDNVASMYGMFEGCSSLTSLDVSNFNTSNVTGMSYMFSGCSGLISLDVSNFNTENVTSMYRMFYGCSGLTSLDVSNFNTSNVKDMGLMFDGCSGLTSLDVSNFNTEKVTSMGNMFDGCSGLTSLDVSNFNTSNVTSMYGMFWGCSGLTSLDASNFNTSNVTDMSWMFSRCSGLTTIKVNSDKWNTANVTKSENMFYRCTKLVGGAGTTYDSNHTDVAYAHIDGGPSNPGYLTGVNAPQDNVTISAKSYTREYGEENPALEYDVTEGAITSGTPEITCEATAASAVGTYDIVISKGSVSNNEVVLTNGTLTITKAPLTIKANSYTIKQGEALPEFAAGYEGFKNGETSEVLTKQPVMTTSATSTSEPGTYEIAVSGAEAGNYEISYVAGTLTITEAEPVKVTAKSYTIEYGESIPEFEYTSEGAALSGVPEIRCKATAASPVGTYDIVVSKGSVSNYNDTYVNGTLTITKAPLTISVGEYTRQEGEENPEFELTYEGLKNGESDGVLTKKPVVTCLATKDSESGEYVITIEGAEAENYEISYVTGKLTVTAKPLPEITPIEGETTVSTDGLSEADLTDNVVNDVYYNVGEQGYDASEKSIVISEATNMAQITDKEPGSKEVRDGFNGIILKVGRGFGLITVSAKTSGNAQLVVQVGESGMPMIASRTEKGDVVVSYDVSEDTYVYIYAILGSSAAKLMYGDINDTDTDSSVRIYGITVSPGATGVRNFNGNDNVNGNDAYYTLDGKKLDIAPKKGGIYIKQGRLIIKR